MRNVLPASLSLVLLSLVLAAVASAQGKPNAAPVNPAATPSARALLQNIDGISGEATLSGEHNFPNTVSRYSDRVYELTDRYPAVFGQDFGFSAGEDKDSTLGRPSMIQEVIRQYRAGAVIALTWHAVRPTEDEPVTFRDSVQGHLTDYEWQQVLTPGTDLYRRWERQVDVIAGYLGELQNAGVPVLFRPYHEMNGNWFWWGGRPGPNGSQALYRQLFDRYVHVHHLNNLVWVWNVNAPGGNAGPVDTYYPGNGYADVLTIDIYGPFEQSYYDAMLALAGPARPIALAEVGTMPTLDVLAKQPRWAYFMMWSGSAEGSNTPEQLQAMFHAPNVVDRGDKRLAAPMPAPITAPLPVTPGATPEAAQLLARLAQPPGAAPLLGEELTTVPVTRSPADRGIVELTLTSADLSAQQPLLRSFEEAARGNILDLRWTPPRPTDHAATGALTDFEWQQLITPGTDLHNRWAAQVDAIAVGLKGLQDRHVAVLWSPYPESNTKTFWWAGRPGPEGSAALSRMLFDRLTQEHGLHNLVWNWEPAMAGFGPGGNGALADVFPGALYADTITLDLPTLAPGRFRPAAMLRAFSVNRPIGVRVSAGTGATAGTSTPAPAALPAITDWQWVLSPPPGAADHADAGTP